MKPRTGGRGLSARSRWRPVSEIRKILHDTMFRAVNAVGDGAISVFFKSDPALVSSEDPRAMASFRAPVERQRQRASGLQVVLELGGARGDRDPLDPIEDRVVSSRRVGRCSA